jgi:hypothetical protein
MAQAMLFAEVFVREPAAAWISATSGMPPSAIVLAAGALVVASASLAVRVGGALRPALPLGAAILAVAAAAPVNILLHGGSARLWRPDVETALLAAALALLSLRAEGDDRWSGRPHCPLACLAYVTGALALLQTALELDHVSTPLTCLAATVVPLALFLRRREAVHAEVHGYALVVTAAIVTLHLLSGRTGRPADAAVLLGAVVAGVLLLLDLAASRLRRAVPDWLSAAGGRFGRVAGTAGLASAAFVALGALPMREEASSATALLAVFAAVAVAVVTIRAALRSERARVAHVAVLALLALYVFLARRTGLREMLEGHHLHALVVLGGGLYLLGRSLGRLERVVSIDGLLLPVPAVLVYAPVVAAGGELLGPASSGLFLAAAVYGAAAYRRGSVPLGALSVGLANLAIFAFWRVRGILDPAFYGVPAGLSLLLSGEALRGRIEEDVRKTLFALGAILLYGSVGIQVLRVEEPTHALVLFGLGILTVVLAFVLRRTELQLTGTAVVVLDVVAYLLRHGFEESFLGAALLVLAGITVLVVAAVSARRRE